MAHWSLVTYNRPSTTVRWFEPGSEILSVIETLKSEGAITTYLKTEWIDGLKQYYKMCFKDVESALAITNDETFKANIEARDNYIDENGISVLVEQFGDIEPIV